MKNLIIVGAGGYGRELLQWCIEINDNEPTWEIKGFIDDDLGALDGYKCDYTILSTIDEYNPQNNELFAIAIAEPMAKKTVIEKLIEKGAEFTSVIHPTACIGNYNSIGKGIVMYPNSRITVNAEIGDYVTILDQTVIGHDARVGDYTTICGSCGINGNVEVGAFVFIGSHVTIVPLKIIGDGVYIGAGSVVVTNVKSGKKIFGVPARTMML